MRERGRGSVILVAALMGGTALASPAPALSDRREPDVDAELRSVPPEARAAVLRAAFLKEMSRTHLGPDTPKLVDEIAAVRLREQDARSARNLLKGIDDLMDGGELEEASARLDEAERNQAPSFEIQRRRRRLLVRQAELTLLDAGQLLGPLVLPLLAALAAMAVTRGAAPEHPRPAAALNPYLAGRPVRDPALFYGREALMGQLLAAFQDGRSSLLLGERRIGKTSMLLQLGRAWREAGNRDLYVDLEGSLAAGPLRALHDALAREVSRGGQGDSTGDLSALVARLTADGRRLLLCLDEVDIFHEASPDDFGETLLGLILESPNLVVAMAGVSPPAVPEAWRERWERAVVEVTVPPLDSDASRRLLLEPGAGALEMDEALVAQVLRRAQGRPMRLQLFGLHLMDRLGVEGRNQVTIADLRAVLPAVEHAWAAIQEAGLPEQDAPLELDAALYEIARLRQEVLLLDRELDMRMRGAP